MKAAAAGEMIAVSVRAAAAWMMLALLLVACQGDAAPAATRLAIEIQQDGIYRLNRADLLPFGWDLAKIEAANLQLSRGAQPVPFTLAGTDRELRFFGEAAPNRNQSQAIYFLAQTDSSTTVFAERPVSPDQNPPVGEGFSRVHAESNTTYLPQVRDADPWLGDRLFAPGEIRVPLTVDHPADGVAAITVRLWAGSEAAADPDHHLTFDLNGQAIGESRWDGAGLHEIRLQIDKNILKHGENILTIAAPGDTGAPADLVYLDAVDLDYPRHLIADNDSLGYSASPESFHLAGFSAADIELWDATGTPPTRLIDFNVDGSGQDYFLDFSDSAGGERRYWAAAAPGFLAPASLRAAADPIVPPAKGADYIAITHPSLVQALQPLLEWRQTQGLRVAVVTTDAIADQFGNGVIGPDAIRNFLKWATQTWPLPAPRFVLLAGDASYDAGAKTDLVPTGLVSTAEIGETASDTDLADLDRDGLPDLAIGRLPARTPDQLRAMTDKTLAYEQHPVAGDWRQQAFLVADDDDAFFSSFNDQMAALLSGQYQVEQATVGQDGDVRAKLLAAWQAGQGLISYMGHGATSLWAQEEILTNDDISRLDSQGKLPFVVVWACLSGYFHHPEQLSLGEALMLTPNRGAVAALVPTGSTFAFDQLALAQALFGQHLFTTPTVGEALLASYRELDPTVPGQQDIVHTFVLLGDPALSFSQSP